MMRSVLLLALLFLALSPLQATPTPLRPTPTSNPLFESSADLADKLLLAARPLSPEESALLRAHSHSPLVQKSAALDKLDLTADPVLAFARARLHLASHDPVAAIDQLTLLSRKYPTSPQLHLLLAGAHLQLCGLETVQHLQRAHELDPSNPHPLLLLAAFDPRNKRAHATRALAISTPNSPEARRALLLLEESTRPNP